MSRKPSRRLCSAKPVCALLRDTGAQPRSSSALRRADCLVTDCGSRHLEQRAPPFRRQALEGGLASVMPHFEHPARSHARVSSSRQGRAGRTMGYASSSRSVRSARSHAPLGTWPPPRGRVAVPVVAAPSVPCRPPTAEVFWSGNLPPQAPSGDALPCRRRLLYPVQVRTRKSLGEMMRKLSVTASQYAFHFLGTSSRRAPGSLCGSRRTSRGIGCE